MSAKNVMVAKLVAKLRFSFAFGRSTHLPYLDPAEPSSTQQNPRKEKTCLNYKQHHTSK
jgi:hypothetical protein